MTTPARRTLDLAMSEAQWQATVIDLARTLGWMCLHVNDSRRDIGGGRLVGDRDAAGLPDWLLIRERVVFAELKRERGALTPAQHSVLIALAHAHAEAYCWKPSDWPEVEQILTRRT